MLSKTTTGFSINTQSLDTVSALSFTVATELTELYEPGSPVDPAHRVDAIRSASDAPIIFSVGTDNGAYVIFPSAASTTGWDQVDLRVGVHAAHADVDVKAQAYVLTASQDQDGTFRIALAIAGQSGPRFFVSRDVPLAQASAPDFWRGGLQWIERPGLDQAVGKDHVASAVPTTILLGTRDDGAGAPTMIAVLEVAQVAHRFFVNTNLDDQRWTWVAYELTQDLDRVDDVILGTIPLQTGGLRGTFVIGHSASNQRALYFTTLPDNVLRQDQNLNYLFGHLPPNATAIAALPGEIPNAPDAYGTDLYIGGDGLYVLRAADMGYYGSDAKPTQIVSAQLAPGIQEIVGSLGGSAVSLWYTVSDAQDDLVVVRGTNQYTDPQWMAPVPLFKDVLQIAPLRDAQDRVEDVIMVTGDNKLRYLYQDQKTTLWTTHDIAIHDTGNTVDVQCYQLKLGVKSDATTPFVDPDKLFSLSSSQWGYLTVNNVTYLSSPEHPISVAVDDRGALTITQPATGVTAPIFHVDAPFLTTGFDVHPAGVLNQQLGSMNADVLMNATLKFNGSAGKQGDQVLTGDFRKPERVQSGAQAIRSASAMSSDGMPSTLQPVDDKGAVFLNPTSKPINQIDTDRLRQRHGGQTYAWGFTGGGDQWAYAVGEEALNLVEELGSAIVWYVGDLFHHSDELVKDPLGFLVHLEQDTLKLFVKLKDIVIEVALFTLEQALRALAWLLDKLFGIDLSKLLAWLGFLFDFQYYQYTQQYIDATISDLFGKLQDSVPEAKQFAVRLFDQAESYVRSLEPMQRPAGSMTGQQAYDEYIKPVADIGEFILNNPIGSWIIDKLVQALGLLEDDGGASWELTFINSLYDAVKHLLSDEIANLIDGISDVAGDIAAAISGELTMNQLVGQVAGDTLIHALEAAKDLVIAIFDVLDAGLEALRNGFMKEGIQIPILSAIYHRFTGQDLRIHLMQMLELVAAIPATALAIFINGEPPFRHAHPTPLAYTLDFSLPLPPAPARSTSNGSAPRPAMALAATAGAPAARSGSADSERPAVSGTEAWLLMSMYSVGKAVAMLCEVLAGAAKAKNKSNGLIAFIRVIQFVARAFEAGGGAGLSLRVTDKDAVKGLKIAIVSVLGVRLIADAIIIFSGWKPNGYVPINDGDGGGGESSVEFFNKCLLGASFVCLCVNFTLEYIAIGLEWGDNKVEDDALLVVQQAFEYTGSFVSVASDAFELKGQAFIASVVTVALVNVVALGSNIARTAIDAEHHRNY